MASSQYIQVPTQSDLEYYYQEVLQPRYLEKLTNVDIGKGKSAEIPKLEFERITLKPDDRFKRGGRTYRPRDMFLNQNNLPAFKKYAPEFRTKRVQQRIDKATKMPKLEFSLKTVELIKPRYGKNSNLV